MSLYALGDRRPELRGSGHYIAPGASLIGSILLESDVNIWFNVAIRADNDLIHLGRGCNIQDGSVLHVDPGFPMRLEDRVSIGHKVMLHGCSVGEGTLIGINSVILNGARIGRGSLIGANTLIAEGKEIPDGVLVMGSPGRVIRDLRPEESERLLKIADGYIARAKLFATDLKPFPT